MAESASKGRVFYTKSAHTGRFVSAKNQQAAAKAYVRAAEKSGDKVPTHIKQLAQGRAS